MKNFTAAMLSFYENVVSHSPQSKAVKKLEVERFINNRAKFFKNISARKFLWGCYSILLGLLKTVKGGTSSFVNVLNSLGKYRRYLDLLTGSQVYLNRCQASIIDRSFIVILAGFLTINAQTAQAQCTGVAGTVFRDFNLNGKKDTYDIGLAGVTVKTFNSANAQIGATATTAVNGTYSITGATGQVRVEFSGLPSGYLSSPAGTSSSSSVQFVTANACNVNYGVNQPEDFCAKEGVQPKVAVPCYANGIYSATGTNGAGLEDALVSFAYNKTGDKATTGNAPYLMSSYNKIGAVWGMAYNKFTKTLFTTAFMKRHSGFGPKGIAGLYVVQNADNNGSGYIITGINLETITGLSAGFAGTEPTRNLVTDKTEPADDGGNAVFDAVGKMSFGDCELSEDGTTLYITNLYDKKIYAFNVSTPTAPTLIGSFLVPSPGCAVSSEYEPFGLKYYRGKLYVGVICTAQSSQPATLGALYGQSGFDAKTLSSPNLKAIVYEFNGSTFVTALTQFPLDYDRGFSNSSSVSYSIWRPWVSTWSQIPNTIGQTYPQPMLSDIEFDTDGSMILGFADRFSHQLGNANYPPGQTYTETGRVEGDVMRATKSGSIWAIENNGTASGTTTSGTNKGGGPGGGEYYFGDITIDHDEPAMGGLLLFPGTGEVMTTTAGPANIFNSGGTRRINNQTGDFLYTGAPIAWNTVSQYRLNYAGRPAPTGDYKLYEGNTPSSFGKASGLGDMEIFCSLAPLEIGNRIWRDLNQDGIQGAAEPGIVSVTVLLFKGGIQVASTSTNTDGEYYFNDANVTGGLLPNMAYQIRVLTSQVGNTFLSPKNAGGNDLADSDGDGTIVSGYAVIDLTTGIYGESNHTYDVGFSPNCLTLSNAQPNGGSFAICTGDELSLSLTASNIGAQPLPLNTSIKWCSFNSVQINPYTTTGATCLTTASTTTLADGIITANNLTGLSSTPGTYYVYALLNPAPDENNSNCSPYLAYIITVSAIPSPPSSVSGGSACNVEATVAVSMSAICASGTTPIWYSSTASTTALATSTGYSPSISATTTFYVGCKDDNAGCETAPKDRRQVVATVIKNVTNGGIIAKNQTNCGSFKPVPFTSVADASGGSTAPEYIWLKHKMTSPIDTIFTPNDPVNWPTIIGATGSTYAVSTVLNDSYLFIRCARSSGDFQVINGLSSACDYIGESNVIVIRVNPIPAMPSKATVEGAICLGENYTLSGVCASDEKVKWYDNQLSTTIQSSSSFTKIYSPTVIGTYSYTISCINSTNCETELINRKTVSVEVKGLPTVKAIGAAVCEMFPINLTADGVGTFLWTGPAGFNRTEQNPSISSALLANAGTYTVSIKDSNGCTGIATTSVIVKANPTVTFTSITICAGTTGNVTASGADTYSWTGPDSFTATGANPVVSVTGTYTVIGTSGGCTAIATTTVGANGAADIKATSVEICTGGTGTTTLTAMGGVSYSWTGPGNFTATGANPVVTIDGLYTVTGTNAGGCIGTATASLTIKANPTVSITGNTTICTVGSTTLTANSNGTYLWSGPNNFTATSKDVSVDKTGLYTVTVSNNGCQAVGTVNVVADEVYVKAMGQVVCEGIKKIDLTSIISTKSGVLSYAWVGSDGFTSTEKSPLIIKPTASATYTLTVITNAGCTATATATITVTPAPTGTYAVTFCKGGKATLTANGGFNATYSWTGGFTTSSIQASTAGTYDVTVTDTSGCISKGKFFVTESAAANAIITGNTSLCTSTSTKLTVNEGATGETYTWTGVGGFTSNSQMITVITPGDYAVLVKTQEGCEGTNKVTVTAGFTPTAVCGPVCEGDSIRFSATQLKGLTYSWSKNGTFISSSADPKLLNVQKSDAGIYQVVITGGGCTATVVATLVVYDKPTGLITTAINSTCDGDISKNDGQVKLAGVFTGLKYDVVEGATYTGTKKYADAIDVTANGIVKSSIANPATAAGTKYTVRVFNANNCYTDYTVTIQQVTCSCGVAKCVPYGVTKTKTGKK